MTDMTRILAFKSIDDAALEAGRWKGRGYHVALVGPTDAVRLSNGDGNPAIWESGEQADWYVVIASKAALEIIAAKTE
jgi:hypothetical protein